jgi:transposase
MNQLQAIAINEGILIKQGLWSKKGRTQLESLQLAPWATRRRQELLELLDQLTPRIEELTAAVKQEAERRPEAQRLMTHPGVGPITALAFVLILGTPERFQCGKQLGSYLGLIPCEDSSADSRRLGHITKQGNALLRFLLVEAAQGAIQSDPDWRHRFLHLAMRRQRSLATVAMARRLAVRLYWMWRNQQSYQQASEFGSHVGQPVSSRGVK